MRLFLRGFTIGLLELIERRKVKMGEAGQQRLRKTQRRISGHQERQEHRQVTKPLWVAICLLVAAFSCYIVYDKVIAGEDEGVPVVERLVFNSRAFAKI